MITLGIFYKHGTPPELASSLAQVRGVRRFDEINRLISQLYNAPEEQRVYRQLVKLQLAPAELPECL